MPSRRKASDVRPCPTCNYLLNPSDQTCRFCGTNIRAAEAAATEAAAQKAAAEAAAQRSTSPLSTSVIAAVAVGVVIVALVGFLSFRGGSDQPAAASAKSPAAATVPTNPPSTSTSSTMAAPTPETTSAPGYTLFGIPNASANLELPTGTQVGSIEDGDFVKAELGDGVGLGIGSVDELPLGGTSATLLAYMQQEQSVEVGDYQDELSALKTVPNLAGPAVSFNYRLDDGVWGQGTMVLIGKTLVMVQLVASPGTAFTAGQVATYNHAVSSVTGVL
jgi:hypothetical protein